MYLSFSAIAWLAGVVSLNDLRLSANLPRDNLMKATVANDGKIEWKQKLVSMGNALVKEFKRAIRISRNAIDDACYQITSHELLTIPIIKYFSIRSRKFCPNEFLIHESPWWQRDLWRKEFSIISDLQKLRLIKRTLNSFTRGFTVTKHL